MRLQAIVGALAATSIGLFNVFPAVAATTDTANTVISYSPSVSSGLTAAYISGGTGSNKFAGYNLTNNGTSQFADGILGVNLPELSENSGGFLNKEVATFTSVSCTYTDVDSIVDTNGVLSATVQTKDGLYHVAGGTSTQNGSSHFGAVYNWITPALTAWTPEIKTTSANRQKVIQAALVFTGADTTSALPHNIILNNFAVTGATTATFALDTTGSDLSFNFE